MTLTVLLVSLFGLLAIGTPVGFAMAVSGALGLYVKGGAGMMLGVLTTAPLSSVSSYELITVPMFLLMAEMVLLSGVADDLFRAAAAWIGRVPGGLGMATAMAGAGFGAICGTSTASAATLASTSLPAMIKQGYEPRMAAGVVAISGTLAMLLPTSVALIVSGLAGPHQGAGGAWRVVGGKIPPAAPGRADAAAVRHRHRGDLFGGRNAHRSLCHRRHRRLRPGSLARPPEPKPPAARLPARRRR
jgi:hypothetical protein